MSGEAAERRREQMDRERRLQFTKEHLAHLAAIVRNDEGMRRTEGARKAWATKHGRAPDTSLVIATKKENGHGPKSRRDVHHIRVQHRIGGGEGRNIEQFFAAPRIGSSSPWA